MDDHQAINQKMLDACRLFLKAGADPTLDPDGEGCTVRSWVATKAGAAEIIYKDADDAALFDAMYEMMEAKVEGREF